MQEKHTNWDGVGQANKKKAQTGWTGYLDYLVDNA